MKIAFLSLNRETLPDPVIPLGLLYVMANTPAEHTRELFAAQDQHGTKHVFIVDSVFNLPPGHAKAVCREMIGRGFGSDSGVDAVLVALRKGFKTSQIRALHRHAVAAGIPDCHTFILGTQGESLDTVRQTLDFCADLAPFAAIMMIWTYDYEALDGGLAAQRRAFREQIKQLVHDRRGDFRRWIIPPLAINFDQRLFRTLRRTGHTGPLWQHIHLADDGVRSPRRSGAVTS
jgi:hypothetical protein